MNIFKKGWSLVLSLALCLGMCVPAFAANSDPIAEKHFSGEFSFEELYKELGGSSGGRAVSGEFYRGRLKNTNAEAFYDALGRYYGKSPKTNKANISNPPPFSASSPASDNLIKKATLAFIADHTTDWLNWRGFQYVYGGSYNTVTDRYVDMYFAIEVGQNYRGTFVETLGSVGVYNLKLDGSPGYSKEVAETVSTQIAGNYFGPLLDKIAYFSLKIIERTEYKDISDQSASRDWVAVFNGTPEKKAQVVCESYAKALKVLCDKSGINNILISGTMQGVPHMWNYVKPEGSSVYYLVDVTNIAGGLDLLMVGSSQPDYINYQFVPDPEYSDIPLSTTDYVEGSVTPPAVSHTLNIQQGTGVTVTADTGTTNLATNTVVTLTVVPSPGYENPQLFVDNVKVPLEEDGTYQFSIGDRSHDIRATAVKYTSYSVSVKAADGVDVAADKTAYLHLNETVTVTVTPKAGYEGAVGILDGKEVGLDANNQFTFPVSRNHTVSGKAVKETFVESITVAPSTMTIGWSSNADAIVGVSDLTATVVEKAGKDFTGNVTWKSSDTTIITVSETAPYDKTSGTATAAVKPIGNNGTVTITATADTKSARCVITVTGGADKPVINPDQNLDPEPPVYPSHPIYPSQPNYPDNGFTGSSGDSKKGRDVSDWTSPSEKARKTGSDTFKPVNETTVVNQTAQAVADALKNGGKTGVVTVKNALSVSFSALRSMQSAAVKAGGKSAILQADSMKNGAVESRVYLDTSKITADMKGELKLRVFTENPGVQAQFTKTYKNKTVVIRLEQDGAFGMEVEVATKVNLDGMEPKSLTFYTFDSKKNSLEKIAAPKHFIDSAGYLHFFTSVGGNVVISDGPLSK